MTDAAEQRPTDTLGFLAGIYDRLEELIDAVVEPTRYSDDENIEEIIIRAVTVETANTPVQGPDIPVPKGYHVVVRQRNHSGDPVGRVAFSRNAIQNDGTRSLLRDGDAVSAKISNLNRVWVDADTASIAFELMVER